MENSKDNNFYRKRLCISTLKQSLIMETIKVIIHGHVFSVRSREITGWNPEIRNESRIGISILSIESNSEIMVLIQKTNQK